MRVKVLLAMLLASLSLVGCSVSIGDYSFGTKEKTEKSSDKEENEDEEKSKSSKKSKETEDETEEEESKSSKKSSKEDDTEDGHSTRTGESMTEFIETIYGVPGFGDSVDMSLDELLELGEDWAYTALYVELQEMLEDDADAEELIDALIDTGLNESQAFACVMYMGMLADGDDNEVEIIKKMLEFVEEQYGVNMADDSIISTLEEYGETEYDGDEFSLNTDEDNKDKDSTKSANVSEYNQFSIDGKTFTFYESTIGDFEQVGFSVPSKVNGDGFTLDNPEYTDFHSADIYVDPCDEGGDIEDRHFYYIQFDAGYDELYDDRYDLQLYGGIGFGDSYSEILSVFPDLEETYHGDIYNEYDVEVGDLTYTFKISSDGLVEARIYDFSFE